MRQNALLCLFERQQESDRRVADEEKRHSDMLAKTARLREQRLARDAAEAEAGKKKTKPRGRPEQVSNAADEIEFEIKRLPGAPSRRRCTISRGTMVAARQQAVCVGA